MAANSSKANFVVWGAQVTAHGPMELPELVAWVKEGRVAAGTWIFDTRSGVWVRAADVPELQLFFQVRARGPGAAADSQFMIHGIDIRILRCLKLLSGMTDDQLQRFAQFMEVERVPQWSTVVKQGDFGDAMYLILEGELHVRMIIDGQPAILASLSAGDFFGDIALLDHGPRSADVVAATGSLLLRISADAFERLSREAPDLATPFLRAIGKTLTARLRTSNKHRRESFKIARALEE